MEKVTASKMSAVQPDKIEFTWQLAMYLPVLNFDIIGWVVSKMKHG
jgi:hypothetical protein